MKQRRVAVWWLALDGVAEDAWPRLAAVLDDSERVRATRFHFERDRQAYVAAHALGRALLSAWTGAAAADWRFVVGDHGKPEVVMPAEHEGAPRLRLNLSHTRGLAAAALTLDHDIGVDVEWLDRKAAGMDVARRFFAAAECAQLESAPDEGKGETFLAFWTLKEAYVKAIGKGLAQPLDSFAFTLEPPTIRFDDALADDPAQWLFRRFQPTPRHVMALAVRAADAVVTAEGRSVAELLAVTGR